MFAIKSPYPKILEHLTIVFICLYVVAAISVSLNRYWQFNAFWYELGLYNSAIWKVAHFEAPRIEQFSPPFGKIIFADHFNPSLFLYSPIYFFTDKTEAILLAQAITVGAGAYVAFKLAKGLIKSNFVVFSLVFAYLGYVGLQNALYTDFHDTTVATFFVMLTFWAIFKRKWFLYFVSLALVLGFKENMPGLGVGIGLFLILGKYRNIKIGLATIIVSIFYYLVVTKFVIPYFSGGTFSYLPTVVSENPLEILASFFNPSNLKLKTIFFSLLTFGFAPIASLAILPAVLEHFAERFVFSQAATRWDLGFHYNATLSPLLFVGSLPFAMWISKKSLILARVWAFSLIFLVFFLHRFILYGPLLLATDPIFYQETRQNQFMRDFFEEIPKDGLIMTQNNIAAHLSTSKVVLLNLKDFDKTRPDVVALDLRGGQNANNFFPSSFDDAKKLAQVMENNELYVKREISDVQLIFLRKSL